MNCNAASSRSGPRQARHGGGDAGVEVVLLVEAEGLQQPSFEPKYRYSVGRDTLASAATSDSCNLPAAVARQHDESGRQDPSPRRLLGVGGIAEATIESFTSIRVKCHTKPIVGL